MAQRAPRAGRSINCAAFSLNRAQMCPAYQCSLPACVRSIFLGHHAIRMLLCKLLTVLRKNARQPAAPLRPFAISPTPRLPAVSCPAPDKLLLASTVPPPPESRPTEPSAQTSLVKPSSVSFTVTGDPPCRPILITPLRSVLALNARPLESFGRIVQVAQPWRSPNLVQNRPMDISRLIVITPQRPRFQIAHLSR